MAIIAQKQSLSSEAMSVTNSNHSQITAPEIVDLEIEEAVEYPQIHHSGVNWVIPDSQYLPEPPFLVTEEERYILFKRHHRAQLLDVDIDADRKLVLWKIETINYLLEEELFQTAYFKGTTEEKRKNLPQVIYPLEQSNITYQVTKVPADAMLDFNFMERKDNQTSTGNLVEISIRRKKIISTPFRAPRNQLFEQKVKTTVPLKDPIAAEK